MVKEAIATFPSGLNYGQFFTDKVALKALNVAAEKPKPQRGEEARRRPRAQRGATTQ